MSPKESAIDRAEAQARAEKPVKAKKEKVENDKL